jgi:small subunit ribosomal protein S6
MIIVDVALDDQAIQNVIKRTGELVVKIEGTVGRIEKWGRRKLAYEINKKPDGYYALIEFTADAAQIKELDRQLRLTDEIIRHKVIMVPPAGQNRTMAAPPPLAEIASGGGRDRD